MHPDQSQSSFSQPKLTKVTRNCSPLPKSHLNLARQNPLKSGTPYAEVSNSSNLYDDLPPLPPNQKTIPSEDVPLEEFPTRQNGPVPCSSKPLSDTSSVFGDDYVPLSHFAPVREPNASRRTKILRHPPSVGSLPQVTLPPVPSAEPSKNYKRSHQQYCQQEYTVPSSAPPALKRCRTKLAGASGRTTVPSRPRPFRTQTDGYVFRPTAFVTDEDYHFQNQLQEPLDGSSRGSRVRKQSGSFVKVLEGAKEKK